MNMLKNMYGAFLGSYQHFFVIGSVALMLIIGYVGAPFIIWTVAIFAVMIGFKAPTSALITFGAIAFVLNTPIRRWLLGSLVLKLMKAMKMLPKISATEKIALDAGVVWADKELFSGKPDFKFLMNEKYPELTAEEKSFMDNQVNTVLGMVDEHKAWQDGDLQPEVWDYLKKEKFFGLIISKEYGGLGFSPMANSEMVMKLASRSLSVAITAMVPNSLGPAELLMHYGTKPQKEYWLPRLADGREVPCFALTEPQAGSDVGSMQATGVLYKGTDGKLMIRLNWNKRFITLASAASVLGLAFLLQDPDNLLGTGDPDIGITVALVPSNLEGVTLGMRHDPLGVPFINSPLLGKDVIVSVDDAVIGGKEKLGHGWAMLMDCLAAGRGISLPAQSVGSAKIAARASSAHCTVRRQFNMSTSTFEGVREPLARIFGITYLMEAMRRFTLSPLNRKITPPVITAIAKYNQTELFRKVINDTMDAMGGSAISKGPRNLIAGHYKAAPIGITVEGANILTRSLMIFGQGAMRAHPYAYKEIKAAEEGDLKGFDKAFFGHIGHIFRNLFRTIILSLTRGRIAPRFTSGRAGRYLQKMSWISASFALMADIGMASLGGGLKVKQKIAGRYADILSWMHLGTAVVYKFIADGKRKEDLPFLDFGMGYAFSHIQKSFDGIYTNMKVPGLTWFFKIFIYPWSRLNNFGSRILDKNTNLLVDTVIDNDEVRDRLTDGIYFPKDNKEDPLTQLEEAFQTVKRADIIEKKLRQAVRNKELPKEKGANLLKAAVEKGVLSQEDADFVKKSEEIRWDAIQVDHFPA